MIIFIIAAIIGIIGTLFSICLYLISCIIDNELDDKEIENEKLK